MKIKILNALALLCMASATMAQPAPPEHGPGGMGGPGQHTDFATMKAHTLARIDARTSANAQLRSCVQAAAKVEDLRACREQEHAAMEAMRPRQ